MIATKAPIEVINSASDSVLGAGNSGEADELIVPNPDNVGTGLAFSKDKLTAAYSPLNFMFTDTYGIAPANTTLTIRYLTGGGLSSNVASGTLTNFNTTGIFFLNPYFYVALEGANNENIAWLRNLGAALIAVNGVGALLASSNPRKEKKLYDVVLLASCLETIALSWSTYN
mgnify:CR=1 FL=1